MQIQIVADIFISYARADQSKIAQLVSALEENGHSLWWDQQIEGGRHFAKDIEKEIRTAKAVIVAWSASSLESHWVLDEASYARDEHKLVPISLEGTLPPFGFRQIQSIDFSNWPEDEKAFRDLSRALAQEVDQDKEGKSPSTRHAQSSPDGALSNGAANGLTAMSALSRRKLIIGGIALSGGFAAVGGWQMGLFQSAGSAAISMAVLRFANLTGDESQSWFSDGLSNELRQVLSRNPLLRVSAPTSSTADVDEDDFSLGRSLGVRSILRGSVQRMQDKVRIFAELLEIEDGFVKWSESYDRSIEDVFAVQSQIAEMVAFALVTQIASEEEARRTIEQQKAVGGTSDIKAYEAYLQGMAFLTLSSGVETDRGALERFETAIALDPKYATAHAARATAFSAIANASSDSAEANRQFSSAISAARTAIEIEPNLADGHQALAFALSYGKLDFSGAYRHYKKALELAPGDPAVLGNTAIFHAYGGQRIIAQEMINRVLELDPLNARSFRTAGFIALLGRDYEATIRRMDQALSLNPKIASANYGIGVARLMKGDFPGAKLAFDAEPVSIFKLTGLAITADKLGDQKGARNAFEEMIDEYGDACLYQQAQVHAQWGDKASALPALARAFETGDPGVLFAPNDPLLDPIRAEPSFDQLISPAKL